jgi:predicted DNA-binding transcriptional regulator AlpA
MDLKNLISRRELATALGVVPQTIAKWERLGLFPHPTERLSDRLILYDRDEVRRAIEGRKATRRRRVPPGRHRRGRSPQSNQISTVPRSLHARGALRYARLHCGVLVTPTPRRFAIYTEWTRRALSRETLTFATVTERVSLHSAWITQRRVGLESRTIPAIGFASSGTRSPWRA